MQMWPLSHCQPLSFFPHYVSHPWSLLSLLLVLSPSSAPAFQVYLYFLFFQDPWTRLPLPVSLIAVCLPCYFFSYFVALVRQSPSLLFAPIFYLIPSPMFFSFVFCCRFPSRSSLLFCLFPPVSHPC